MAFLLGYQLRTTYDFSTNVAFISNTREANNDILIVHQALQRGHEQHSSKEYQHQPQVLLPTQVTRPTFSPNPTYCEKHWDWPFLDAWIQKDDVSKDQDITFFKVARSNRHETASGAIQMQILRRTSDDVENRTPRRVIIYVTHSDAMVANAWHRIAVQYMVWMAWQVAEHRLSKLWSTIAQVELAIPCVQVNDVPQGWNDLLFTINNNYHRNIDKDTENARLVNTTITCTRGLFIEPTDLMEDYGNLISDNTGSVDVVLIPPSDGLLWDLAWDTTFTCTESHMFRAFLSQFSVRRKSRTSVFSGNSNGEALIVHKTETHKTRYMPVACWILRYGNPQRDVNNRDEVHGMLLSIFDIVRLIHITRYHTSDHIQNTMNDCQVFYGVHGAGMVNAMWTALYSVEKTAVVEVLPENQPQYFRSVSALVGHYYEGVTTHELMENRFYHIDLEQSAEALRRALNFLTNRTSKSDAT